MWTFTDNHLKMTVTDNCLKRGQWQNKPYVAFGLIGDRY